LQLQQSLSFSGLDGTKPRFYLGIRSMKDSQNWLLLFHQSINQSLFVLILAQNKKLQQRK